MNPLLLPAVLTFVSAPPPSGAVQSPSKEAPLTNQAVVKLCALDLGDDVVLAKIQQAKTVAFSLEPEDLAKLKQQGVSKGVIAAMIKRATPIEAAPAALETPKAAAPASPEPSAAQGSEKGVSMKVKGQLVPLKLAKPTYGAGFFKKKWFLNDVEPITTVDRRPEFLFDFSGQGAICPFAHVPVAHLAIIPVEREENRFVLPMGMKMFEWSSNFGKRLIRITTTRLRDGVYSAKAASDLEDGAYSIVTYDFDAASSFATRENAENMLLYRGIAPFVVKVEQP